MNNHRKTYKVVSGIIAAVLLYSVLNLVYFMVTHSFTILLNWRIFLSILPELAGLIGAGIFVTSRFKRHTLLQVFMCYAIISFPFSAVQTYLMVAKSQGSAWSFGATNIIIPFLLTLLLFVSCCIGLWLLTRQTTIVLNKISIGGETVSKFAPVKAPFRFFNRFIDILIIVFLFYNELFENFWFREFFRGTGASMLFVVEFCLGFYYYFVLEAIFNTTVGKCVTGTTIVNESGNKPGIAQIIGRTVCRFIPLEAFSFFGRDARGWHDSLSVTYVVKAAADPNENLAVMADHKNAYHELPLSSGDR